MSFCTRSTPVSGASSFKEAPTRAMSAEAFPTEAAVNEAWRGLDTTNAVGRTRGLSDKALQPTSRARRINQRRDRSRVTRGSAPAR
jgi:hypothetical protein